MTTPPGGGTATARPSNWNVPNALTVLRILLVPVFVWILMRQWGADTGDRWWAFAVFALAMATDKIDGDLARKHGLVTDFGKIADPIADKALTGAAFVCLSLVGDLWWWVTIVILVREWGITLMRFVVIRYGVMPAGKGGKLKTVLQSLALALLVAPTRVMFTGPDAELPGPVFLFGQAVMAAALVLTVVTGVQYVRDARRLVAAGKKA